MQFRTYYEVFNLMVLNLVLLLQINKFGYFRPVVEWHRKREIRKSENMNENIHHVSIGKIST